MTRQEVIGVISRFIQAAYGPGCTHNKTIEDEINEVIRPAGWHVKLSKQIFLTVAEIRDSERSIWGLFLCEEVIQKYRELNPLSRHLSSLTFHVLEPLPGGVSCP